MCPTRQPLVCWALVKGIGYLNKFCIAHRDFCLEKISFVVGMKVDDEDEMGKIEEKSM